MFPTFTNSQRSRQTKSLQRLHTQSEEKSFHVNRQTFYPNYFKKVKATEFLLKQNHTKQNLFTTQNSTSSRWNSCFSNSLHQNTKAIHKLMKKRKGNFENEINHSFLQVNNSFNRYVCNKSNEEQKLVQQRKKIISCKNILKELKQMNSLNKLNFPLVNLNQKNLLEMAADTNYEISILESKCFDSMFPFQRYGAGIVPYQNLLFLYGGFSAGKKSHAFSCFHKYDFQDKIWTKVQEPSTKLVSIIPCFHTIDTYKNYMILVGGISVGTEGERRKFNSDICIYNFEKKEWSKLRSSLAIRSHASTLFGNTLLIHGGVDEKQANSNLMHFINFNANSIQNSLILTTENREYSLIHKHSLSHHKIVNTNEIDPNLKMLLKYDGVFCFGGVNSEGQMHNDITFLNCIGKQNALDVRFQSWVTVQLVGTGPRPQARKNHTFNVINKKAMILLIGGQNAYGQKLNDIWVFNLVKLQWKQINPTSNSLTQMLSDSNAKKEQQKIEQGISGHCSTFMGTRLLVFGGKKSKQNKKENCLWEIETDIMNNYKKNYKIEKMGSPSINTIKESTRDESMWNIQF